MLFPGNIKTVEDGHIGSIFNRKKPRTRDLKQRISLTVKILIIHSIQQWSKLANHTVMFNLNWKVLLYLNEFITNTFYKHVKLSCCLFKYLLHFLFLNSSSSIQKQLHHKYKRKRIARLSYLEKRPDTLLSTLSQTAQNSITRLSENSHEQMVTRSTHPRCPTLIHCMIQGSQNIVFEM